MSIKIKKIVCYSFSLNTIEDADAMGYLRVVAPYISAGVEIISGVENDQIAVHKIHEADAVLIQRNFPLKFPEYQQIVRLAHLENKPVIFELDDLFFMLPEEHPDRLAHHFTASLLPMLQAVLEADLVTVATPGLHAALSPYSRKIAIIPNHLDDRLWHMRHPAEMVEPSREVTIGYMGTNSHRADLLYVLPVLLEVLDLFPQKIRLRFWGVKPPEEILSMPAVEWMPFYSMNYRKFVQFFQTQQADIFIAPLIDHPFNRCKSPLKYFEYTAMGVPAVYSAVEPYASVVRHAETGLLAATPEEWKDGLTRLVEDPEMRIALALRAQAHVRDEWLLSKNSATVWDALQQVEPSSAAAGSRRGLPTVLDSINTQSHDLIEGLKKDIYDKEQTIKQNRQEIEQNQQQIEQNQQQIEQLNAEILSYVLSRSWTLTRPFRMIHKKIKRHTGNSNG